MTTTVLTRMLARLLLAPILMVALAVLVKGYAQVGDGFSAGVIAALGVLLQYLAFGPAEAERLLPLRNFLPLVVAGLLLALAVALLPLAWGDPVFTHQPPPGESVVEIGTLELITAVAFDVAVFLLVLGAVVGILRALVATGEEARR